jgi:hypothetical protein
MKSAQGTVKLRKKTGAHVRAIPGSDVFSGSSMACGNVGRGVAARKREFSGASGRVKNGD